MMVVRKFSEGLLMGYRQDKVGALSCLSGEEYGN